MISSSRGFGTPFDSSSNLSMNSTTETNGMFFWPMANIGPGYSLSSLIGS